MERLLRGQSYHNVVAGTLPDRSASSTIQPIQPIQLYRTCRSIDTSICEAGLEIPASVVNLDRFKNTILVL